MLYFRNNYFVHQLLTTYVLDISFISWQTFYWIHPYHSHCVQTSTGYKELRVLFQQYGRHRQSRICLWPSRARELHRYETPGCAEVKQLWAQGEARGTKWCWSWVWTVMIQSPVTCMKMPPNEEKTANLKGHFSPSDNLFCDRQLLFLVESELLQNLKFSALIQKILRIYMYLRWFPLWNWR